VTKDETIFPESYGGIEKRHRQQTRKPFPSAVFFLADYILPQNDNADVRNLCESIPELLRKFSESDII
jgi:hypothetical protein